MNRKNLKSRLLQVGVVTVAVTLIVLAFIPIFLMVEMSLKTQTQIYGNFWALPDPINWENYSKSMNVLFINMINSIATVGVSTLVSVFLASLCGYVFAKQTFPGKKVLYMLIISLMMIPPILTLTPLYKLIQEMHLNNTWMALILPWSASGQVFGIILCRTFISEQPNALFEASRIDGATEFQAFFKIALPLAKPIIATMTVMNMVNFYNDYIWPLMSIDSTRKQVITVAVRVFTGSQTKTDTGVMMAGYVFATIPLLILFLCGSRLYIEGITSGAVKS